METAKVDIEKLQQLNDRIVQTIEALNQVRMSVHGLQASRTPGAQIPGAQFSGFGLSHTGGFGQQNPWVQNPWLQQNPLLQQAPWLQQYPQQFSTMHPQYQQTMPGIGGIGGIGGYGLSHSGFDPYRQGVVDPTVYARIVQTFPFLVSDPSMRQFF